MYGPRKPIMHFRAASHGHASCRTGQQIIPDPHLAVVPEVSPEPDADAQTP